MPSQHTSGSYGSFHDPRLPGPGPPLPGATHVDLPGDASSDQRRAGRFVAFLIIVVLGALVLRAYQQNEPNGEVGKERMRCERELATERERWREELRRELERWERALGRHVPQGAFWDGVWPAVDCRAYDTREYWGTLQNIPKHWTDLEACMNMPVEIKGVGIRRPYRCAYVKGSPHIRGYWMVGWDQPDCRPWLRDFHDKGCINSGSGMRRIEAQVVGILNKKEQNWRLLCGSTPMTWNNITYDTPTHCDERRFGRKVAIWDIPDEGC